MAQGDVTFFDRFWADVGDKLHDLSGDSFYLGIVTNSTVPSASTADPRWGASGTTNFASNEVTPGGNYAANGVNISAVITDNWSQAGGVDKLDFDDVSIAQDGANPSGAYWGIIYNSTDAGKRCVGFIDLGGPIDLSAGPFSITWSASGFGTVS